MVSLKQQSIVGVAWNLIEQSGIYLIKFVIGIILARLLTPDDFGLIGMIYVFFAIAEVFVNGGLGLAFVQKKQVTDIDANTIFYTNLLLSAFIYGIIFFCAPFVAKFYKQVELVELTRVMGFIIVINAFNVIQQAKITREVDFKRRAKVSLIATLISGSIGVVSAYLGMGVWALVIHSMTNRTLITIGFWITSHWKPRWQFSIESLKGLSTFGSWVLVSNIFRKIFDNIYVIAIGRFFPASQVGFFTKSKGFQQLASENLAGAINSVAFPVYSRLQDNKERLRNGMRKFMQYSLILIVPLMIGLIVVAEPFVLILITEKWIPIVPYLQLLCISGIFFPLSMINVQSLTAQGKIRLSFQLNLLQNVLRIINIAVMYRYGVIYIIYGEIVVSVLYFLITAGFAHQSLNYGIGKQINDVWKIISGGIIAGCIAYTPNIVTEKSWILLLSGILLTALGFIGTQYLYNRQLFNNALELKQYIMK